VQASLQHILDREQQTLPYSWLTQIYANPRLTTCEAGHCYPPHVPQSLPNTVLVRLTAELSVLLLKEPSVGLLIKSRGLPLPADAQGHNLLPI
jgi:hypothetical protein